MKTGPFDLFSPGEEDMSAYPDEQLVQEALGDSHPAFEQLVEQYQYRVLRTIASIISDEQAAQDVAQETFLSAWSNLAKLRERHKFGRWLNQIAISYSKRWLRDQLRYQEDTIALMNVVDLAEEQRYNRDKLRQAVWEAIDELGEEHREAIILHYISGYSYKEIGEMLSVPVSTIQGRLQKARNQLRKEFLDMVTKLQLEIDSTVHKFLKEHAKQDGVSIEGLIIRLIERYKREADETAATTRRVWENALASSMDRVSPDGRYASYVNWDKGNLAIHDFQTGENRDVTDEGNWGKNSEFADHSIWSPDSKQIAYVWFKRPEVSLRIVGIDGSKPRVLCSRPEGPGVLAPRTWSQDSRQILAVHCRKKDKAHDIVLVAVADGSMRVLKSLGPSHKSQMSLSPDGRYVAYDYPQIEGSPERDIFLTSTDGSYETTLVEHPANDFAPFWAPDGNRIVFASDRSGSVGIWVLEVVDGKPEGYPQLISDNLNGMFPLGLTRHGSYYYGLPGRSRDIYFADLDPETGKVVNAPTKAVQNFEGFNYAPAFSPDGKRLAYVSHRPRLGDEYFTVIVIHSLETGERRELSPKLTHHDRLPQWSPDGRSILTFARGADSAEKKSVGLYLIDTETDAATPVVLNDEHGSIFAQIPPVWSPDGNRIFFVRNQGDISVIRAYDCETGREWSLDLHPKRGRDCLKHALAISPNGQQLAFVVCFKKDGHSFQVAPAAGGETREILRLPLREDPLHPGGSWLAWTPDGRHLLFDKRTDEGSELWRVPVKGGEPQNLGLTMRSMNRLSFHPDGRRITFTGPGFGRGTEVYALENILPKSTASK